MEIFLTYLENVWHILLELAPWLLLGTVIAGLLHVALPANFVRRNLRGRSGVLRAVALGRKNYLFAGSDAGGERAAAIYSLLGTARLNGLDPESYLCEVLTRIAEHPIHRIEELLPWRLADQPGRPSALAA